VEEPEPDPVHELRSGYGSILRHLPSYVLNLRDEDIRITCNLFVEKFWLDTLALPSASLCKSVVNVYSKYTKKKRTNRLPFGTCRIAVSRTRVVQSIFGSIQEYGGFQRDEWIDAPT
jgi:hypothetical protein